MYYVYMVIDIKHNKKYIGQHKTEYTEKADMLNDRYCGKGARIKELIKQHGKSIFDKEILQICESKEDAEYWELYYIDQFDAIDSEEFYNLYRTASEGLTPDVSLGISETKKEYYKDNPGKHSEYMKKWYSNPKNRNKYLSALCKRYGYKNIAELEEHRGDRKHFHSCFYNKYPAWFMGRLVYVKKMYEAGSYTKEQANIYMIEGPEDRRKYPGLCNAEIVSKSWENADTRESRVKNMQGPRPKTRGIGKSGQMSYIDQVFLDAGISARKIGGWADAFATRYRGRKYRSIPTAEAAIMRQCNKLIERGYDVDVQEAIAWYVV